MEDQLVEVLNWLKVRADGTEKFILEQAPLYVQEVVAWEFWSSVFECGLGVLGIALCLLALRSFLSWFNKQSRQVDDGDAMIVCALSIAAILLIVPAIQGAYHATKAAVAPRVVIIEHLRSQTSK